MDLPAVVIEQDRKYEQATTRASEELAKLRWHWTLDESNPERVPLAAYARAVGRDKRAIGKYAHGYALWRGDASVTPLSEAIERAGLGADKEAATEAVAETRGLAFQTVRQTRPAEVKRVLEHARERAEKLGSSVSAEAPKAAEWIVKSEQAAAAAKGERKDKLGLRFVQLEERLQRARRELVESVNIAASTEWGDEEQELLEQTLVNVKSLLELLNLAIVGASDVDWDDELAALGGQT